MIAGMIQNWGGERNFAHPVLRKAIDFLAQTDFSKLEARKYPIEGDKMFALLMEITTKSRSEQPAEKHERFLDIHYLVEGTETIGWGAQSEQTQPIQLFDPENDFAIFDDVTNETELRLIPGMYVVFFPEDIHRPGLSGISPVSARKVVLKIDKTLFL